ncbi:MAG: toxin-antitoxin system [Robiginitomaculum sp.]|nr:MAG: toxin-antitoxin system [Robiginitomaculum sp.]
MANTTVGIRLDDNTQARLKKLGNSRDRSPHYLMKEAVESYLKREEDIEVEKALLKSRWEKFELTGETVAHSDMKSWAKTLSKPHAS